ncbi:MAG: DinB family protein [Vicinamibacteria bacterium]|nr:DinB family protein [Vicinamibacteria bacterium]
MKLIDLLIAEFEHEARTTRPHLERLPNDKLGWQPHPKSFTAGGLASHIVECVGWAGPIFGADELDIGLATCKPYEAASVPDLLKAFDDKVAEGTRVLAEVVDADLMRPWRLKVMGRVRFEKPKAAVFRDFTLSHLIHHRGQLSVYLRLLNVPVPGSYGPTADEGP